MPAPTFVADYAYVPAVASANATLDLTCGSGDVIVVVGQVEDNAYTLATPTGGTGLTWAAIGPSNLANYAKVYAWTTTASASNTAATITVNRNGANSYWASVRAFRFSGSDGIGATAITTTATSGTPNLALTTTQSNSAVVCLVADWNAIDATTRTWRTINGTAPTSGNGYERNYARDASVGSVLSAYWPDAGSAGSVTTGLSAPTSGWKWLSIAVEVKGTTGGATPTPRGSLVVPSSAAMRSAVW